MPASHQWLNNDPLAPVDPWVVEVCGARPERSEHIAEPVVECDQPANIEWAIYHLRNDAPPAIEGEGGEFTTLKVAMTLRGYGISEHRTLELMLAHYNVDGKCVPLWEVDGKNGLATKVENAFLYANLEAPGAATAEADFKDDPPPPLTAQELEQQRRFREKHRDRTRQQGQSDRRHRVSRGSDFGAQAYPGRKSVMSGQRKPGNVVPLKTKIRRGIAWPELTQGGSPRRAR